MKILVVGAGIGGLAFAAHAQHLGYTPTIVDIHPNWEQEGYAIGLWSLGLKTLEQFNINALIKPYANYPTKLAIRNNKGKIIKDINCEDIIPQTGPAVLILRSDLHKILLHLNKDIKIKLLTTVTAFHQANNKVFVEFSDGTKDTFDLVVGADGIHSGTRKMLFKEKMPHDTGVTGFIYTTNDIKTESHAVTEIWSGSSFFGAYPLTKNRLCAIFAISTQDIDQHKTNAEILNKSFRDYNWIVKDVLHSINTSSKGIFKTPWEEVSLQKWHVGRVVLLGDAAHAMVPTFGMGGSMALEDAYVLAQELNLGDIPNALKKYEEKRIKRVNTIKKYASLMGSLINIQNKPAQLIRDSIIQITPTSLIKNQIKNILTSRP